ncbi:MARTX multifunctional-autoprocessing repeats-in-toxin holotoxin RtxA [Photobacterium alginatilyticum]|uniref:MARTX multifunctional-autoprocessing repeats-in-toxin holotoxin RtxA n=1 Tax=Photobacterium alginatilyticum TaxID=1775171 RepID=UPI0040683F1B
MGKPFWRSVEYFFTGNYSADDGNNNIVAIGFGGEIHAYGGDDTVTVGSIGATVYTGSGNDTVQGGSAYLKVNDTVGNLNVRGAAGYADINKSGDGNVSFAGAAGGVSIDHTGNHGDVKYGGVAAYNGLTRKGLTGNVTFEGAGGYNSIWHETNQGNLYFAGAGAGNKLDRTWFSSYQGSHGDVTFNGVGAANSISSRVETGNISFRGAGADNHIVRKGKVGNITLQGAGASNRIERTRQAEDTYSETGGNIRFEGVGGYNSIYSDVANGNINFSGGGAYNEITRKGSGNDFEGEGLENANADDIVLTNATMSGSWIGYNQPVTAIKSAREPNTYLFAFADGTYTKINKVQLSNDPQTGKLKYFSTAWYKEGNHLENLADQDISSHGGFNAVNANGAYTLSDLTVEHQQSVTVHAVEKDLTEYEWVTYADGALIDAADVTLSDAKMGGHAISTDGSTVDVQAVKSNRKPNTYIYASLQGPYTKIVVVELANDPETGALKYQTKSWYKNGDYTANIANEDISAANGYYAMGAGGYSLSDLQYSVNAVRSTSERVADIDEYSEQALIQTGTDSGESSGDVRFNGAGGGNVIKSNVTRGNVYFNGGGIANVILHSSKFGNTEFNGGGAANVIVKSGQEGDLTFRGAGLANVLVHQSQQGKMDVYAGGAVNVLARIGDGQYLAHLLAYGNISVHKGNGDSRVVMFGGYNTHTQVGSGNGTWLAAGGFNVMTQVGKGDVASVLVGGANVLTKVGDGDLTSGMIGGANVITHISGDSELSDTTAVALGGANILTKKGKGNTLAVMGGGANVLTHVGDGTTTGVMVGGANVLTKVGNGDTTGIMLGIGNVLTHVGDGQTLGVMGAVGNIFTKVGDGTSIAAMIGAGNIFTHVGGEDAWALMGGLGNVFTKVGNGNALALMVAEANVFTHIGDGLSVALMLAKGNIATKVGNGMTLAAMVGNANIFTHVGNGTTFAAMIGQANIMTKVGDELTAALMVGKANIYTHVGNGTSIGMFAGELNVMTKVGNGTTLAAMFGKANIMTHVGDGLTGVLALGEANIVTKVGDDFMGVVAAAKANVVTHVGDATTAAVLAGKGNILTKVGEGTTVGLLISDIGNVMTHVGGGATIGFAKGKANIITKVGDGLAINAGWGKANVFTHVGDGDRYNFAKGEANLITKVGDGQEVAVVHGKANIITHVGDGDDYTGAWGKANVITKVGNGRNVVLAKADANIVTQVGKGDSFNALWGKGNIVTKVGDGMQVTAAKGKANITTTVGNGLSVTAAYGDANINTKVGNGVSINVAWGKYNVNTKVGDGLNVAVMKGKANVNIHVGDGLGINASYARNNVAIKIGNGDFYSLAVASSNTKSNKLSALFDNIKQTVLGVGGSQAINYLVQGDDASSSGARKGKGAIELAEVSSIDGFQMDEIEEVGTDLGDSLSGGVTDVETPDLNKMQGELDVEEAPGTAQSPNLIVNGGFEQGGHGWSATNGIEASFSAGAYGVSSTGHGSRVSELDTYTNTSIYQDLANLSDGEVIALSFDFAKRAGISNNEGIEVIWNGNVVFSTSGDDTAWQQKTLKLTAQAGSNRIEFKGTGHNDGLGYVLDNVVAKSEMSQQANAVSEHAEQNKAAQNAMADKERAEADRQRLEQEKDQQLAALSGSQSQLESTDQQALENNGQSQRDAVKEESDAVTEELTSMTRGLDALDGHAEYQGESGDSWREHFAGGVLDGVQGQLDSAKDHSDEYLPQVLTALTDNQKKVQEAVASSEAGAAKGEQNRAGAEQDIVDAKADAEARKTEALSQQNRAEQAESEAHSASDDAQSRGERESYAAENKASQAQADAKGAKQSEGDRPDREGASGSGLSGKQYQGEAAGETASHVDADAQAQADGRFSEGLTDGEQEALEGATQAVNRLQINAGVRAKKTGSSITSMFTETNRGSIVVPEAAESHEVRRKEREASGVTLEGLGDVADASTAVMKAVEGFQFSLLETGDTSFTDSTKRHLGKLSTDLPSKELKEVRRGVHYVQQTPSEDNLAALEQALQKWQKKCPNEFARRSELVKPLKFEIASLQSHIQASRAKDADVFGIAIDPKAAEAFESKVVFDGIGRVAGLVEPLAADEISRLQSLEVVSPTQTNSTSEREAAKTESENIVEFVYKLSKVDAAEADASEISQLAEQAKALWMSGNVTQESAVALFSEAHDKLTTHPELQTLAGKLLSDAQKEKATGQYLDNLFGRRFDSEIAHELVKTPTEQAINTSVQIGTNLVNDFDEWMHTLLPDAADDALRDERIQKKMEAFAKAINKDARPWFSRVPTLTQFLETPNYDNFKTMMTQVDDGFGVIKVPFLAVKMAITPGLGMEMAPWKAEGDRFYQNVITKARSTSALISSGVDGENQVNLIEKKTSDYGTALHYQPKGDAYEDFQEGRSVADGRILTPGKETTFESNALNNGLSVVTGASGSTNIMMHLNQHLASKNPGFSVDQAYLNTLSFLVFDGGHSVNESLAVYKALQETGDDRKAVLESYTANYQDLVELVGDDSKDAVRTALDNAFEKTLEFYKEHAHSASEELEALGGKRQHQRELMNETVAIENDGTPPRDKSSLSPLTRFLNDELYGSKEDRRNTGEITQALLDHAVAKGESDKVTLKGDSGRLTGYFHHAKTAQAGEQDSDASQKVVLFLHGSGSSAEEQASAIRNHYQKQGMDMLAVNMRGYGESDGGPSEKGLYQDARTMFSYLVNDKGIDPSNIIIHGYSMGGPIAADLARYAAQNGKAVSGLLLDRPMPSMTKAITGHEVPNPAGIVGALSKAVNGQFSVEKNLKGLPKETPIMLLTDNEGLGTEGEKMRAKLTVAGYNVTGEQTFYGHEASNRLMSQYAGQIVSRFVGSPDAQPDVMKGGLLQNIGDKIFDLKAGGKELEMSSFHFSQGADLLNQLTTLIPEVGNVLITDGNDAQSKDFLEGVCFALSARYMMEERVHGLGGGKAYMEWLKDTVQAYNDNTANKKADIGSVEQKLLNQYRRQNLGMAVKDLLSMQYSQLMDTSTPAARDAANKEYGGKLKANGLTGPNINDALTCGADGYESVMDKLRNVKKSTYMTFMSQGHAMSVVVHKKGNQKVWSFYDPNFGTKSFAQYDDFRGFMDNFHKGLLTKYKFQESEEAEQSFYVQFNKFEEGEISGYDGLWKDAREGEQSYVLRALKEQGKTFSLGKHITGKVADFHDGVISLEVTTKKGRKVLVDVTADNISQAANLAQSNIGQILADPSASKLSLQGNAENGISATVTVLEQSGQEAGADVLKGIKSDLQRYGEALKPDNSKPGKTKDIRATKDFLGGYKQGYADQVVDGFRSDMNINQLVDLLVKGNWTAEQKGALAWEIESRALKVTFQPKVEKFNRLFRDVASAGAADSKASEQLAPQLLLLNLSNDGFGGRCDPLSKLVLVAKQLENDGQAGVAGKLLEKLYSAAAVLSNPELYSETERANAGKLLGSLAAIHAKNPMNETSIKVWQEKLEGKQALTVNGVVDKITDSSADGKPVLLELDAPGHAMAAWAKGSGENRVYGFYDPNAGVVEFSSAEKFGAYLNRFFGKSDLNMAQSYRLVKNEAGEVTFNRVVVMDGSVLATYKPTLGDKTTMQGILELPVFDSTPMKKPVGTDVTEGAKTPGQEEALAGTGSKANNQDVESWEHVAVTPKVDGGETRFDGQVIIQTENDPAAAKAAANLAAKHPESSVVVQLDADGNYRVVYGEPSQLSGKLRWQLVGHGRDESENNNTRLSGYSATELAAKLVQFNEAFSQAENITSQPEHISIVGCSLVSDDKQEGFARRFVTAMDEQGLRSDVSARSTEVAVDSTGRKHTRDANDQWGHNLTDNKVVLSWNEQGEVVARKEAIRNGVAEGDIDLARVGQSDSDAPARGAIADNGDVFTAPEKRNNAEDTASSGSDSKLSYSGNIQVNVGNGEFTAVNWGTSNVGIKVGNGGFKSLAFGDNNVMVHVGNGDSKHSFDMAGYQALEGAQMFIGNRNVSFNMGRSNDLIVMADKSIPTPPMVNPFDGASRISGVLQGIARSGEGQDWLAAQEQQWTLSGAEKFVKDMSGLDQTSSVDYTTLVELDSQNERSSRGLKSDAEATLNKQYNQWLSGNGDTDTSKMSRADKFRQANEKLAFNFAVGGQGADIQVTTGNWNFMFGDNIQSILDTNLGSLFGLMTQQFSATGQAKTTFTYNPEDLPRQLKNKLLGKLAGVGADTTLGDIFGVDYSAGGHIISRDGEAVDGVAILTEMLEVIGEFSGDQLQSFVDPSKLLDSLESSIDMGVEGIKSFAETHGLKETAPEGEEESSVSVNGETVGATAPERSVAEADSAEQERAFGFNALNLPNLFATIFSKDKQDEMASLVTNLKENLTADLLNMKEQTFDFLRNSGHLQGDGDINVSLGNYNFNWGGDGKDLGAYLGDNNNFWGGRGDDVYYATGTSNIFTGGEGNDMGVLMGRENMMFGGNGNDTAVVAGRINHVFMGAGDDQSFVFGEGGEINTGTGQDYVVTSGNFNRVDTGEDQDYSVTIGSNNQVELGGGNDFANVFGNYNRINGSAGNDVIKLMGYHAVLNGGEGDDHLIAAAISKFSQFDGGIGRDLMVLGGYQNTFRGGEDVDSFVVSGDVIDNLVEDIRSEDNIVFNGVDWQNLWFERSGYDLKLSVLRKDEAGSVQDQFESVGAVTFTDYFNGNRAELVIGMGDKDASGEREYTALSDNAVDALVQAMSTFAPTAGDNGFIDNLDSKSRVAVTTAWADVTNGKGAIA